MTQLRRHSVVAAETSRQLRRCRRRSARNALTLFELLLALAILLASLAALSQLIASGTRAAVQGRLQTEAVFRCQSKLAEIIAGAEPLEPASNTPFSDDSKWSWRVEVEEGPFPDLTRVEVTVSHTGKSRLANSSHSLRGLVRDPALLRGEDEYRMQMKRSQPPVAPVQNNEPAVQEVEDADE